MRVVASPKLLRRSLAVDVCHGVSEHADLIVTFACHRLFIGSEGFELLFSRARFETCTSSCDFQPTDCFKARNRLALLATEDVTKFQSLGLGPNNPDSYQLYL